jgi:peptidyl-prolyl cis-trans isomerase D
MAFAFTHNLRRRIMLRGIHKASTNWLGKAIMACVLGLLVVSFAIWGIGDIFRGFGLSALAKVGRTEISVEQFRQIYNDRLQQLSRQIGRPISQDQARAIGFDRQVIGQVVAEAALDERARQLRLGLSDAEIAKRVMNDPSFQGISGQFDRGRFDAIIRQAGYTEPRYVAEQRRVLLRQQLADTVAGALVPPKTAIEALHRYENEERTIEYVALDRSQAGDIPPPTPETLAKYFEERKALFRAPEYRKLVVLTVTPTELAKWTVISDAEARRIYDERRARYATPERRHVQQIVFPKAEDAQAASDRIAHGLSFEALAAERGLKDSDIDLGTIAKSAIIDRAVADAAFSLKAGEVSAPVQGRFGTALVRVDKIEAEQVRQYEQVAAEIKQDVAVERAKAEVSGLRDKIEDARASGDSLAETAQKLKLASTTIEATDRSGRGPDGVPVPSLPQGVNVVTAAFTTDVGVEVDPLQVEGGGFVWYEVVGITPSHDRTLDEVKNEVEARWRNDEITTRLIAKTNAMLDKLQAGTALKDIAAAEHLKLETASGLKRGKPPEALSAEALDSVFRAANGAPGAAQGDQPTRRIVFRVTHVVVPDPDVASEDGKRAVETLRQSLTNDLIGEYVARVEAEIGTTINPSALSQVVGGGTN